MPGLVRDGAVFSYGKARRKPCAHNLSDAAPGVHRSIYSTLTVYTSRAQRTQARDFYDYAHMRVSTYSSVGNGGMAPVA